MKILRIGDYDLFGGAERSAMALHAECLGRGHRETYVVARKLGSDPAVSEARDALERGTSSPGRLWHKARSALRLAEEAVAPSGYRAPPTAGHLLRAFGVPDVVQVHNANAWDLRTIRDLSRLRPTVLTLHDSSAFTGGCSFPLTCDAWRRGCSREGCLSRRPPPDADVRRRAGRNWRRKRRLYRGARLHLVAPSAWMLEAAETSILARGSISRRVIPNAVDTRVFRPGSRHAAREALGLPREARILLFVARRPRANPIKDYPLVRRVAAALASGMPGREWMLLLVGVDDPGERRDGPLLEKALPFLPEHAAMARCYHAADLVLHASHSESWGRVVTEAMACGRAVVATRLPPIAEQVEDGVSGFLSPPGDEAAFLEACRRLLADDALRAGIEDRAAERAREHFSLERQTDRYLDLYAGIAGHSGEAIA